jgi:hypothetical protein
MIVDWYLNSEQLRVMANAVDDYLYEVMELDRGLKLGHADRTKLINLVLELAKSNHEIFNQ